MSLTNIKNDILSATDVGLVREVNEDSCGIAETPNGIVCVVCDGMGGHSGGEVASGIAVNCIVRYLSREACPDARQALKEALEFANLQIIGTASERPELQDMGTTACVLLVQDDRVWFAHAGDSRIYLYVAKEKRLHRLTRDHSFVQGLVEQGMITEEEAETHPNKNRILKALGIRDNPDAEICKTPVLPAKGDMFLVCSDGLSGMVSDKQIQDVLSDKTDLSQKETRLMELAKKAGGTDNITFQLVRISHSPHKKSVFERKGTSPHALPQKEGVGLLRIRNYAILAIAIIVITLPAGIWIGGKISKPQQSDEKSTKQVDSLDVTYPIEENPIISSPDSLKSDSI